MVTKIALKLVSRLLAPKQAIKKLPPTLELPADTLVEDVKVLIARQVGIKDHNQIGLFDPVTKKTLKDRKAQIGSEENVVSSGSLIVKNLGMQIAWQTVFVVEYFGPLLFHAAVIALRPYLYRDAASKPLTQTQWLGFAMFMGHFLKREWETLFVHKFSASTMPARNIFKNSFFYWVFSGALCATSPACARGAVRRGKIPRGYGFSLVTCPNYMFEITAWIGVIIACRSASAALFIAIGAAQMSAWAKGKERAYRKEFPETYKKKKFVLLPGIY
ncbi:synaptic glycoprotein SC2 [Verticillium alfalfae VaMs.102]|uniref:Synaptic glycoprotein SC2 n=1 Tax=Verticillium alfalfae (strain VaMs.102 / ATCC MYA-4576 / FGSC 10136) TaxID=526221 RepID=C9SLA0_VERA1|nr:synaptic glycoprotein SC2 [Verticillium alfalfae VaMs.102]EEY19468.1 synaptic glycoprotein SC2 [Verticillium alfalfae VaMs.102]